MSNAQRSPPCRILRLRLPVPNTLLLFFLHSRFGKGMGKRGSLSAPIQLGIEYSTPTKGAWATRIGRCLMAGSVAEAAAASTQVENTQVEGTSTLAEAAAAGMDTTGAIMVQDSQGSRPPQPPDELDSRGSETSTVPGSPSHTDAQRPPPLSPFSQAIAESLEADKQKRAHEADEEEQLQKGLALSQADADRKGIVAETIFRNPTSRHSWDPDGTGEKGITLDSDSDIGPLVARRPAAAETAATAEAAATADAAAGPATGHSSGEGGGGGRQDCCGNRRVSSTHPSEHQCKSQCKPQCIGICIGILSLRSFCHRRTWSWRRPRS